MKNCKDCGKYDRRICNFGAKPVRVDPYDHRECEGYGYWLFDASYYTVQRVVEIAAVTALILLVVGMGVSILLSF